VRLIGVELIARPVGELDRGARYQPYDAHAVEIADVERHQLELFFVRNVRARDNARQRRADRGVVVARLAVERHLERDQSGDAFQRRDQQPLADAVRLRFLPRDDEQAAAVAELKLFALLDEHALFLQGVVGHRLFDFRIGLVRQRDETDEDIVLTVLETGERGGQLHALWRRKANPRCQRILCVRSLNFRRGKEYGRERERQRHQNREQP
jgi:hypothetical protein